MGELWIKCLGKDRLLIFYQTHEWWEIKKRTLFFPFFTPLSQPMGNDSNEIRHQSLDQKITPGIFLLIKENRWRMSVFCFDFALIICTIFPFQSIWYHFVAGMQSVVGKEDKCFVFKRNQWFSRMWVIIYNREHKFRLNTTIHIFFYYLLYL